MGENYMKEIANMLGVELGEKFYIGTDDAYHYYFTENGLYCDELKDRREQTQWLCGTWLVYLLSGRATLRHIAWKPSYSERYYSIGPGGVLEPERWLDDFVDRALYKLGNCYRTPQEAEADRDKWIAFYASYDTVKLQF